MIAWKDKLAEEMPPEWAREIDIFETQIELKKQGKIDDKLFAETRLRRGVYGQRYDNGQRHDGTGTKTLAYPSEGLTKGPETMWDAPGMLRIKIPFGGLNPDQMEVLADLAEEYSDGICHVTTRQDIQLHFVHIDDTPDLMRRLAAVGITTREACGNSVRNVTACPLAGVCRDETFDVTPYAQALMRFLLGHPDAQDFGRKFKIAFSGCRQHACALVNMHDLGAIAVTRRWTESRSAASSSTSAAGSAPCRTRRSCSTSSSPRRRFCRSPRRSRASSPASARSATAPARASSSWSRSSASTSSGDWSWRSASILPADERWTSYLQELPSYGEKPLKKGAAADGEAAAGAFAAWCATNVYAQRQPGYCVATVTLPLGDITSDQMRQLADIARRYVGETVRTTVEQNIVLRWVCQADLPALYQALCAVGLGQPGAGTIVDVTACPGTDTCKLGIASSRGLAAELRTRLAAQSMQLDQAVRDLRIKVSGCFNSCGQHHIADLGFYGVSRNVGGFTVPHFQVVLGGQWSENAGVLRSADRCRSVEEHPRGRRAHWRGVSARAREERVVSGVRQARRQEGAEGAVRGSDQGPAARRPLLPSTRTGATRASSPSATWESASAPARSCR